MMKQYTDAQILARVESHAQGFAGWKQGVYLIAVRSLSDAPDAFDDKAYVFECDARGPRFFMVASCTTHPGVDVLKNFAAKYNKAGAPVLKSDHIVYDSHQHGLHQGKYAAYRQAKIFPYFRDTDRDNKAEEIGNVKTDQLIMANVHRANPNKESVVNHNWSAGCVVMSNPAKFAAFMAFMKKRPLTVCILKEF
jgi:hypothetical protein